MRRELQSPVTAFICHATRDMRFVRRLARELERHGVNVWLDEQQLRVGDALHEVIANGLSKADFVIVVLTRESVRRPWVRNELSMALDLETRRRRRVVLPILLRNTTIPGFLRDKKYADFRSGFVRGFSELLQALEQSGNPGNLVGLDVLHSDILVDIRRRDGSVALYRKIQKYRADPRHPAIYVEAFSGLGHVDGFKLFPGSIEEVWIEAGDTHVRTLSPPPTHGRTASRRFECMMYDKFPDDLEFWGHLTHYPTAQLQVTIRFPRTRPPTRWNVFRKDGATPRQTTTPMRLIQLDGKPAIRFRQKAPPLYARYFLEWSW